MQVNSQQNYNINFNRLITSETLKDTIRKSDCSKKFINKFVNTKRAIWKSKINTLKNIDIILNYEFGQGYTASIYFKNSNSIENPTTKFLNITNTDNCIKELKEWGEYWNNRV